MDLKSLPIFNFWGWNLEILQENNRNNLSLFLYQRNRDSVYLSYGAIVRERRILSLSDFELRCENSFLTLSRSMFFRDAPFWLEKNSKIWWRSDQYRKIRIHSRSPSCNKLVGENWNRFWSLLESDRLKCRGCTEGFKVKISEKGIAIFQNDLILWVFFCEDISDFFLTILDIFGLSISIPF